MRYVKPGQTVSGVRSFLLPNAVAVEKVEWTWMVSANTPLGFDSKVAYWAVPVKPIASQSGPTTIAPAVSATPVLQAPPASALPAPPSAFNYCGAPSNPWHYNFCCGTLISAPNPSFCQYFTCIKSFWIEDIPNDGYVVQCQDSMFSLSGGESGACSYHGGELRPLYAP